MQIFSSHLGHGIPKKKLSMETEREKAKRVDAVK